MTDTLTEFLLARLAEEEEAAESAGGDHWDDLPALTDNGVIMHRVYDRDKACMAECGDHRESGHISRHDPFRVLAEVKAKRGIVDRHRVIGAGTRRRCWDCEDEMPCPTLRLLALPYADHPDYRQEWRP